MGIKFLRFNDEEVFYNIGKVLNTIENWIREKQHISKQDS